MFTSPRILAGLVLLAIGTLTACSSGSSDAPPAPEPASSSLTGTVINSPVSDAEVRFYSFDETGNEVELVASNAPVLTSTDGGFTAMFDTSRAAAVSGPLLVTTIGGTMHGEAAPAFAGLLPNAAALANAGSAVQLHIGIASSIYAGLMRMQAAASGAPPTGAEVDAVKRRVQDGLKVDLAEDPRHPDSSLALLNTSVDANLNLSAMPANAPAVDDLIEYLVLNFQSSSGKLDNFMADSAGSDRAASFIGVGSGALANLVPGGPGSFWFFRAHMDKAAIENDGIDTAFLTVWLLDAMGEPAGDGNTVDIDTSKGRLVVSKSNPYILAGSAEVNISSIWPGEAQMTIGVASPTGVTISHECDLMVANDVADTDDDTSPRIVNIGATGNTEVLVSFSEAMRGGIESAENPSHYRIVATDPLASADANKLDPSNPMPEAPEVLIEDAQLILPDRKTVRLTTFSQSDLEYELTVFNVVDLAGNSMAPPDGSVNPSKGVFQGVPPSGNQNRDSDGDGLSDADEQRGWVVTIISADGVTITLEVTSDPFNADTDGDGIGDADEFQAALSPRSADSDGDTLTDYMEWHVIHSNGLRQDTDGDGLQDGVEFNVYRTSPILADTDGDQMPDPEEIAAGNRNPLVSDLPSPRISIGNVNLQLDTRFMFTSETGELVTEDKSVESTITRGEDETFSTSNENSTKKTLEFSQELQASFNAGPGIVEGVDIQATAGSRQGSERGNTFTTSQESARHSEEAYHESLTTSTARDIRESITREVVDATMKVAVSIDNVGEIPFTVSNLELSAQSQDPLDRRRMIPVAALVPENEGLGSVNIGALGDPSRGPFVFKTASVFPQQVQELMKNPRGLVIQLANFDITDNEGNNFAFTSQEVLDRTAGVTFDMGDGRVESYRVATASTHDPANGRPSGIKMSYLFEIIGLERYVTIRDGGNGVAESAATADDVAVAGFGGTIEPGTVIVRAGTNGTIDSLAEGDDELVQPDYETTLQNNVPGQLDRRVLTRFRDVEVDKATKSFWALFTTDLRSGVDVDDYIVRAGEQFDFAFVQDKDDDAVWAREEFLHGSSDLLENTDGCDNTPAPDPCDTLTDKQEIQEGWRVQLRGSPEGRLVYPNPNQGDSDRDTLTDNEEMACLLDPRQRDTDLDGLTDWEELNGKQIIDGVIVDMVSRDYHTNQVVYVITPYDGTDPSGVGVFPHDAIPGCSPNGFATDPLSADTDGDLVNDALELKLGLNPNDSSDGPTFLDDDGDGIPNSIEIDGWTRTVNGVDEVFTSNPNVADSDSDLLPDLLEYYLGSNPLSMDTDDDGLTDTNEYRSAGEACVTETAGVMCVMFADRATFNFLEYRNECNAAAVCDNSAIDQALETAAARQYGTNLSEDDTDFDLLKDAYELGPRNIVVNGGNLTVYSDPLDENSDEDGLNDKLEDDFGTDPENADTDDDSTYDDVEVNMVGLKRDPTNKDRRITLHYTTITFEASDCDYAANEEWSWKPGYLDPEAVRAGDPAIVPSGWAYADSFDSDDGWGAVKSFDVGGSPVSFIALFGDQFALKGELVEYDGDWTDREDVLLWDERYSVGVALQFGSTVEEITGSLCGGEQKVTGYYLVE
jgi:hypothetical protein